MVSLFALTLVFSQIDIRGTWQTICSAKLSWLFVALLIYVLALLISAERARIVLLSVPVNISRPINLRLCWLGMFYNFFLPGGVGGDGYKVYWLHRRHDVSMRSVVEALLTDRLSGLTAICFYTVAYAAFRSGLLNSLPTFAPYQKYLLILLPIGLLVYWSVVRMMSARLVRSSFVALALSFLIQGLQMCTAVAILQSLGGVGSHLTDYLFLFLLSSIASAVPVTLGGVGARELAFMFGSHHLGINEHIAISLSLIFYVVSLLSSLPGIILALRTDLIDGKSIAQPDVTPDLADVIEEASTQPSKS